MVKLFMSLNAERLVRRASKLLNLFVAPSHFQHHKDAHALLSDRVSAQNDIRRKCSDKKENSC